jgi:WD40 repeat protein
MSMQLTYLSSDLVQIYSIDYSNKYHLLVGGGHNGWVTIWGDKPTESEVQPLISYRAHSGWISTVKLVEALPGSTSVPLLLTASNDGTIRVWDLSKDSQ